MINNYKNMNEAPEEKTCVNKISTSVGRRRFTEFFTIEYYESSGPQTRRSK